MIGMKFHRALLIACIVACLCAFSTPFFAEGTPWTGNATLTGRLIVESNIANAEVYCDSELIGTVPLTKDGLTPGLHEIAVMKDGYVREARRISIVAGEETSIRIELKPFNGMLEVTGIPEGTAFEILVDGKKYWQKTIALTQGKFNVTVRAFGFRDKTENISVTLDGNTGMAGAVEKATFAASDFTPSKKIFNPLNPAKLGTIQFSFLVTAPGSGEIVIRNQSGETVRTLALASFKTWKQAVVWDGRSQNGRALPDGTYTAALRATGDDGTEIGPIETTATIDRAIAFPMTGTDSGIGSTGPVVSAALMPAKGMLFGFDGYAEKKEFGSGASIQAGFTEFLEGGAHVSAGIGNDSATAIDFAGGLKAGKKSGRFSEAAAMVWKTRSGTITGSAPAFRNGLSLGPAVEYRLGAFALDAFPCVSFGNENGALANGWGTASLGAALRFSPGDFSLSVWANADSGKFAASFEPVAGWSAGACSQFMIPATNLFLSAEASWIKMNGADGNLFAKGGFGIRF